MNVIIAGGRDFDDYEELDEAMWQLYGDRDYGIDEEVKTVFSGGADGADSLGEFWAGEFGIPVQAFPADWDRYGKSAGYRRNVDMANGADVLVAFWDGQSKGTKHMIDIALAKGLEVHVFRYSASHEDQEPSAQ